MSHLLKIESIKKSRRKGYYDVQTCEGKYVLSESIIVKYEVLKDREFTEQELLEIVRANNDSKLFDSVYNFISYQMRSEKEIRDYLLKKEATNDFITKCIQQLKELNYINDLDFSKHYFDNALRNKKGPKYLENKLKLKGISEKDIKDIIINYSEEKEEEIINDLLINIKDKNTELPIKKQKQRICEKLIRDGFSSNVVFRKVNDINFVFEGENKLQKEIKKIIDSFKGPKYEGLSKYDLKNKLISKLLLRGYGYHDIKSLIDEMDIKL